MKLADFGLAKHLADERSHYGIGDLTQTRDTFGTPYYIAPEALRGRADLTPAADVWAAGVLLYHLLTGTPPLENYTPLSKAAGLPRSMDAVLASALQAAPSKRSANLSALTRGMESALRGRSRRRQHQLHQPPRPRSQRRTPPLLPRHAQPKRPGSGTM